MSRAVKFWWVGRLLVGWKVAGVSFLFQGRNTLLNSLFLGGTYADRLC